MLVRYNVKNNFSFAEREGNLSQEFSMIAGKARSKTTHIYENEKIKILKFAAIYGANASGKSNLIKSLDFMKKIVLGKLPKGYTEAYCKTSEIYKDTPSYFETEIEIEDKYYSYGFEILLNQGKFISEWLIELIGESKEKVIFSRDIETGNFIFGEDFKNKELLNKLGVYADDIREDDTVLFLTVMNKNKKNLYQQYDKVSIFQKVYSWFRDELDINYPNRPISNYSYMTKTENVNEVIKIISAFGTGITGFKIVEETPEKILSSIPERIINEILSDLEEKSIEAKKTGEKSEVGLLLRSTKNFFILFLDDNDNLRCKTIKFSHGDSSYLFDISEESDGTVRLLDLIEVLLSEDGKTYIIDELDRCLHPSLTYKFIDTFLQLAKKKKLQLIVTTHESRLLDFDLLRRDEIWFINKRHSGESDVYSLEEFNTRFDQKIDKAYLEGRYGGVPLFNTLFPIEKEV